jgi:hypothetical protein
MYKPQTLIKDIPLLFPFFAFLSLKAKEKRITGTEESYG